jgi:hypothetical protein
MRVHESPAKAQGLESHTCNNTSDSFASRQHKCIKSINYRIEAAVSYAGCLSIKAVVIDSLWKPLCFKTCKHREWHESA